MTDALFALATAAPRLLLALDYDGTLVALARHIDDARPDDALERLLERLAARADTTVRIVSGRPHADLECFFGIVGAELSAEHGLWWRGLGSEWRTLRDVDVRGLVEARPHFDAAARDVPASYVETKSAGLGWHYRPADPALAARGLERLREALAPVAARHGMELLEQQELLEIRVAGIHKGLAISGALSPAEDTRLVAIGDDRTDEDLFAAAPPDALTIRVGDAPTKARHRLPDVASVRRFLSSLAARPPTPP